jgi:NAD+ synthase (glutamine-hydrolysing)
MKFALGQIEVEGGNPRANIDRMLSMIEDAKSLGIDLIIFPEMAVGGYFLGDKWLNDSYVEDLMSYNDKILAASDGIAVSWGNVYLDTSREISKRTNSKGYHPNKDGRSRKYNALYVCQNGKYSKRLNEVPFFPEGVQAKTHLPNYRFFDDERYFFSLKSVAIDFDVSIRDLVSPFVLEINGKNVPIGFEICEDLWCEDYREGLKSLNVTNYLIEAGAEFIMNLSSLLWTYGKNVARDRRIHFLRKDCTDFVPFFYVNCTGVQNNGKNFITFDGGSTVYNREGLPIRFNTEPYKEEMIVINQEELQGEALVRKNEDKIKEKYLAIIQGLRAQKQIFGKYPKIIIGLSGGIDSSLSAALLFKAFGKENVLGVNMPTKYNSAETQGTAKYLADKLGIEYHIIPIETLVNENVKLLEVDGVSLSSSDEENVQAKIRGTSIQSNLAAKYRGLFVNNGNKLEVALGYATLYGDWGGAIAPLGDLTKTEVVEMSRYMNKEIFHKEVIPERLFPDELFRFGDKQIVPSAELKEAQVDPMKFGYHCKLLEAITDYKKKSIEEVMQWYLDGVLCDKLDMSEEMFTRWNLDDPKEFVHDLEWFYSAIERNVFKRVQAPPIIITSKSSYGYDIRESILPIQRTCKFESLKNKILKNTK